VTLGWFEGSDDNTHIPWWMYSDTNPGESTFSGTLATAFLQDAWKIVPNVTLKIGVRYDQVQMDNDVDERVADMNKLQPRLGLAWDVMGDAKNLLKASWGRFMHPSALSVPSYAQNNLSSATRYWACGWALGAASVEECQAWAAARNYTWIEGPDDWDQLGWFTRGARDVAGSEPTQVHDLKPTYADELIVGFEREIAPRTSVEVTYVNKQTRSLFDDTCIGNITGLTIDDAEYCSYYVIANLPDLKRDYQGATLKFESRASAWFHILASYTYSESEGNLEYSQGGNTDFDYDPDHFVNRYGHLADDRRHRVKLNGFAILPYQIILGVDAFWSSPFNYDRRGVAENAGYGFTYLDPRGDHLASSTYQLDVSASKGFQVGPVNLQLIATIYNLFGTELVTGRCNYDEGCGGDFAWASATAYQTPRRYEAGFRIEF
jgi:outer membrane receptor protein involved in Fe transport